MDVAALLRRGRVYMDKTKVVVVQMTSTPTWSPLQSTQKKQLMQCFGVVTGHPTGNTLIFGGDKCGRAAWGVGGARCVGDGEEEGGAVCLGTPEKF